MAGFDPDVFGAPAAASQGFDPDVFSAPSVKAKPPKLDIANDAISKGAREFAGQGSDALGGLSQTVLNGLGGFVRGAGSIGATLARPFESGAENDQRRAGIDANMQAVGAQPDSWMYKGSKLGGEIAGTAGAGGLMANGLRALPMAASAAPAVNAIARGLETGGFSVPGLSGVPSALARVGTGAVTGGVTAGMVDPEYASTGAVLGGALPPVVGMAGALGRGASNLMESGAERWMRSAVKPTLKQMSNGDADVAVRTLLDNGINPTKGGVEKLRAMVEATDDKITNAIQGSTATIDKNAVISRLGDARAKFANQVTPQGDLGAIDAAETAFRAHPVFQGADIPVQAAQDLKRGTYQVLRDKYGQLGSADTEAQKALARGLKEEIANAVPGIGDLNGQLSDLTKTLKVTERRALMDMNKNPLGLSLLAKNPAAWAAFMADKSALFKSLAARSLNTMSGGPQASMGLLSSAAESPLLRGGLLGVTEANP